MKRIILAILLAITLAVIIGSIAYYNGPGYVVFSFAEYTVETSFIFMLGFIAISFFVFYYVIRVLTSLLNLPAYMGRKHQQRQVERSKNSLVKGLIEMSEGRFEQAEKMFLKQLDHSGTALLNYLMAARAAQQQGEYERRDEYLRQAHETTPSADIAIGLTQAELQLSHKQFEQALATLNHLSSVSPKHKYVKRLLARSYQQLEDWENLGAIMDELHKLKALDEKHYAQLELETFTGMLRNSIEAVDGDKTEAIWKKLPKHLKSKPELILMYSTYLHNRSKGSEAEVLLRNYLSHQWDPEMAYLYSELQTDEPKRQLESAETWLHNQPRNALLVMILGKLCMKCELWGKAKSYFETSIAIKPIAEAYLKLAQLLEEKMEEHDEAQEIFQQGLMVAVNEQIVTGSLSLKTSSSRKKRPQLKVIQ